MYFHKLYTTSVKMYPWTPCIQSACTYFNDRADAGRYEDQQAGLLVKQIEENHDGAETSPQHWKTKHEMLNCNRSARVSDITVELFGAAFLRTALSRANVFSSVPTC